MRKAMSIVTEILKRIDANNHSCQLICLGDAGQGVKYAFDGARDDLHTFRLIVQGDAVGHVLPYALYRLTYDVLNMIVAETTNNDMCAIEYTEISAHHENEAFAFGDVVTTGRVMDSAS